MLRPKKPVIEKRFHTAIAGLACIRRKGGLAHTFCIGDNLVGHRVIKKISFQENRMLTGAIKSDVMTIWRVTIELIDRILLLRLRVIKYTNFTEPS